MGGGPTRWRLGGCRASLGSSSLERSARELPPQRCSRLAETGARPAPASTSPQPFPAQQKRTGRYGARASRRCEWVAREDRKSTRLNSSHTVISYAVFCL